MKRMMTLLLLLGSNAGAVAVDCSTPSVYGALYLTYSTKPGFPNKPEEKKVWLPDLKSPLKICDLTFTASKAAQTVTIEARSFDSLAYITSEQRLKSMMDFQLFEDQVYGPQDRALTVHFSLPYIHNDNSMQAYINPVKFNDTVLALRVDGGKLQPLFYNRLSPNIEFPLTVKTVDIYAQSKFKPTWERLSIDFRKPKITVYLKSPFPEK